MVKIGLTERAIGLRIDVSSDSVTDTSFFKFKRHRAARDDRAAPFGQNKKAAQWRGLLSYFRRDFSAQPRENPLAGGAQIVGRRLARASIRYDLVADLLAFTSVPRPARSTAL